MRGDEAQLAATAGGDDSLGSNGPRHAAPRKSLLTKLQIPTSKALALAAMPTAVFVGMGLTPKLAIADDNDAPRAAKPCLTREDEEPKDEKDAAGDKDAAESDKTEDEPSPSASETEKPSAGDKDEATPEPDATGDAGDKESEPAAGDEKPAEPEATPSPSKSKNPLDPLGVGDAIKDFFTPGDKKTEEPAPEESTAEDETAGEKPSGDKAAGDETAGDDATADDDTAGGKLAEGTAEAKAKAKKAAEKLAKEKAAKEKAAAEKKAKDAEDDELSAEDKLKAKIEEAAAGAGTKVEELDGETADGADCIKPGDLEQGIPLLPDKPFIMETDKLTLRGLDYHGPVDVQTQSGKVKQVLKFTANEIDIKSMHQKTVGPNGKTGNVKAAEGSTTTFRNGEVTMYTEELKGNLFGLIPVTFTPETPPPLNVPFAFFTDATVTQAGQFGGTITVPGLQNYFD
ncbi:hypothetical protein DSC45_17905 [Streptomyces sp. YIM 130001]|uniref:hypothetical protein n=1 Tax=Streptomyces sp. YIM 130001 TaxID=2259644 RepID=UPI000E65BF46|nr:hypothetical protein [Streptomyces sp. YIM 130001]RII15708.1 hypothetical protein DSC45_17905 [Streptomyces sp. YIM 130001]